MFLRVSIKQELLEILFSLIIMLIWQLFLRNPYKWAGKCWDQQEKLNWNQDSVFRFCQRLAHFLEKVSETQNLHQQNERVELWECSGLLLILKGDGFLNERFGDWLQEDSRTWGMPERSKALPGHSSLVCHFTRRKNRAVELGGLELESPVLTFSVHKIQLCNGSMTPDSRILLTSKMQFYRTVV